jgi:hypothetical protein
MGFDTYFRASSYAMIACAMLALALAGGMHASLVVTFAALMVVAWNLEGTKWQLSERTGLVVVLFSVPLFILDWQYQKASGEPAGRFGVNALAHLIIFLAAVKLLQVKKDRDWVFLYLISFFEVLLAAGLSFSPIFLASLTLYLLCGLSTIIALEIQKGKRAIPASETRLLVPPDSRIFKNVSHLRKRNVEAGRLPLVAVFLLVLIFVLALPLFLVAPRSGAAMLTRGGPGLSNFIGFSENVVLGEIGSLKADNSLVMHVRIEGPQTPREIRWRGVALDEFTGRSWRKSSAARRTEQKPSEKGLFQLGTTESLNRLTTQTVFLEPIESTVLFAASRPVAIQGDFSYLRVDAEGSVQSRGLAVGRTMYKALSDMTEPDAEVLRSDRLQYPERFERYLQLPTSLDPRIAERASAMIAKAQARNRYDVAKAIEAQLPEDLGYSLQMRAGGPDPLADFLFNVKAGHCEYFSTAMAVMLRTRGIAARVVNGFLPGEYNEAAGAYAVRQSDAHSWVEVYFPESRSWVTFDPTPIAGRSEPVTTGFAAQLGKYAAALELLWFQYVIGYDKQEQRSLATYLHGQLASYRRLMALVSLEVSGMIASNAHILAFTGLALLGTVLLVIVGKRVYRFGWRRALMVGPHEDVNAASAVVFYERLLDLLARRGLKRESHLTPLEFAGSLDLQPALALTRVYNRVRYGGQQLSSAEVQEIERTLRQLEGATENSSK